MPILRLTAGLRLAIASAVLLCSGQAAAYDWTDGFNVGAREGDRYNLIVSPFAQHFRPSPEHAYVWLVGAERERSDGSLAGAAYFRWRRGILGTILTGMAVLLPLRLGLGL